MDWDQALWAGGVIAVMIFVGFLLLIPASEQPKQTFKQECRAAGGSYATYGYGDYACWDASGNRIMMERNRIR